MLREYDYKFPSEYKNSTREEISSIINDVGNKNIGLGGSVTRKEKKWKHLEGVINKTKSEKEK